MATVCTWVDSSLQFAGIIAPVIQPIWEDWWTLNHPGKSICAFMYGSGLVYRSGENPLYGVWSEEQGGGGPYLAENDGSLYSWAWREDTLSFLRTTLTVDYVTHKLKQAAHALSDRPHQALAQRIAEDAQERRTVIELQISELISRLAHVEFPS